VDRQIGRPNECDGPNTSHQLFLSDQLTWSLDQHKEDVQSAAADAKRLAAFQQEALYREQLKGAEVDCTLTIQIGIDTAIRSFCSFLSVVEHGVSPSLGCWSRIHIP